ncbi:MAG TPA: nicotinate-nucleotide adenylyltransferase [Vicinamibacterales bacterium]|nr:nicotinate-nucleotide adenylyltransferase [Vicinamibacterales bacterium]
MRTGVFGGTFDPIHVGHLDVADAARRALALDQVQVMPARWPPHRAAPAASAAHRFAMAVLAVQDREGLVVSDFEMEADGPSYTSATLNRLSARGIDIASLFVITGADAFREISSWKDYPRILDRTHFVVVSRPGCAAPALRQVLPELADRMFETPCEIPSRPGIFLVDEATAPVSSTDVRDRLARGESIDGLVPPAVMRYIERQDLYHA